MRPQEVLAIFFYVGFSRSDENCSLNLTNFEPCGVENVLKVSHAPCDGFISFEDVQEEPMVRMRNAKLGKKYVLLMLDPDDSRPRKSRILYSVHWTAYDIPAIDFTAGEIKGTVANEYFPPHPTGETHRFQFFVFEQPGGFTMETLYEMDFDLLDFIISNGLCSNLIGAYQYKASILRSHVTLRPQVPEKEDDDGKEQVEDEEEEAGEEEEEGDEKEEGEEREIELSSCSIDFGTFKPCRHENVLSVSHAPCNSFIPSFEHVSAAPKIGMDKAQAKASYLLLMLDRDAALPDRNILAYRAHWIVFNLKEDSLRGGDVSGTVLLEYEAPKPTDDVHRYQFFIFEHEMDFAYLNLKQAESTFNLSKWAAENDFCSKLRGAYQYRATTGPIPEGALEEYPEHYANGHLVTNLQNYPSKDPREYLEGGLLIDAKEVISTNESDYYKGRAEKSRVQNRPLTICLVIHLFVLSRHHQILLDT